MNQSPIRDTAPEPGVILAGSRDAGWTLWGPLVIWWKRNMPQQPGQAPKNCQHVLQFILFDVDTDSTDQHDPVWGCMRVCAQRWQSNDDNTADLPNSLCELQHHTKRLVRSCKLLVRYISIVFHMYFLCISYVFHLVFLTRSEGASCAAQSSGDARDAWDSGVQPQTATGGEDSKRWFWIPKGYPKMTRWQVSVFVLGCFGIFVSMLVPKAG